MRWLLYPFSLLYALVVKIRNFLFDIKILSTVEFDTPVIAIGNITVGGTGKTPHIEYLVALLKDKFYIATLSRGYKRKTRGFKLADNESLVKHIGDEPKQIKLKFPDVDVAVDAKRVRGVKKLLQHNEDLDVILLDDAYQHRYIRPGLSILLVDFNRPILEDFYLPYGRLRESVNAKSRANIIIVTKTPEDIKPIDRRVMIKNLNPFPYQTIYFTTLQYGAMVPVFQMNKNKMDYQKCLNEGFSVLLVTGIANPKLLLNYMSQYSKDIVHLDFPDHHSFSGKDIKKISKAFEQISNKQKIIVTTEKDTMRLAEMEFYEEGVKENMYYIPVEIDFIYDDKEEFNKQIFNYVTKDKAHFRLHTSNNKLRT